MSFVGIFDVSVSHDVVYGVGCDSDLKQILKLTILNLDHLTLPKDT